MVAERLWESGRGRLSSGGPGRGIRLAAVGAGIGRGRSIPMSLNAFLLERLNRGALVAPRAARGHRPLESLVIAASVDC